MTCGGPLKEFYLYKTAVFREIYPPPKRGVVANANNNTIIQKPPQKASDF
jgi:hypothetical protein